LTGSIKVSTVDRLRRPTTVCYWPYWVYAGEMCLEHSATDPLISELLWFSLHIS